MAAWQWLVKTDAGLFARIGVGVLVFFALACTDLARNGKTAKRWREYLFLLFAVAVALVYGLANDEATVRISPEYFLYGKELSPLVEGHPERLPLEAAKVGLKATWSVGLLVGAAILLANNPHGALPQLPYRRLVRLMPRMIACAAACAAALGAIGYMGGLALFSQDFQEMVRRNEFRPYRFMAVYGIHLGGYLGGLIGTAWTVFSIRRSRRVIPPLGRPAI
jgi:hypothetical protein